MANVFTKLFFVEEPSLQQESDNKKTSTSEVKSSTPVMNLNANTFNSTKIEGNVNPKILAVLSETLEKANIEGPDYQELKSGADKMEKAGISDENARYIAAYIGLKAGYPSLTKEHIIKSIDYYIEVVNKEKEAGLAELAEKKKNSVDNKKEEIQKIEETINNLKNEIEQCKKRVEEETNKITKYRNEVLASKIECEQNEADFNATIEVVINKLKSDKEKFNLILND